MDVETKNPRRTRTIIALSVVAAIAVSGVSNVAWVAAHPDVPVFRLSEVFE